MKDKMLQGLIDMAERYLMLGDHEKASEVMDLVERFESESDDADGGSNVVSLDAARSKRTRQK